MTTDREPDRASEQRSRALVRRVVRVGWLCVGLSVVFLYLSGPLGSGSARGHEVLWATYLMLARLCGICSFAIGGVAVFNSRWGEGIAMLLLSVILPFVAFHMHGTF